jgi:DNA modification methylase
VWREAIEKNIKHHPTPKPIKLLSRLIKASSNVGDVVFDPCMGSGSTGMASKVTERNFIGCDLDPVYVEKASQWIESMTVSEIESRWKGAGIPPTVGPLGF